MSHNVRMPAKRISHIIPARSIFPLEGKTRQLLSPPCLPRAQYSLGMKESVRTVVSHNCELNPIRITPPKLKSMHNSKKLLLTSRVLLLSLRHAFAVKCNEPTPLHQDSTQANPTSITDDLKAVIQIRQSQHRSMGQRLLHPLEGLITLCRPHKLFVLLGKPLQRSYQCRPALNKLPEVVCKAQK